MELLPHLDLMKFDKYSVNYGNGFGRELAYQIGVAMGEVHAKTGRFSSEPHDGNILARATEDNKLDIRFCDAIQFREGDLEAAVRAVLINKGERPECFRFIKQFRNGLSQGTSVVTGRPLSEVWKSLNFMREFNDIF